MSRINPRILIGDYLEIAFPDESILDTSISQVIAMQYCDYRLLFEDHGPYTGWLYMTRDFPDYLLPQHCVRKLAGQVHTLEQFMAHLNKCQYFDTEKEW